MKKWLSYIAVLAVIALVAGCAANAPTEPVNSNEDVKAEGTEIAATEGQTEENIPAETSAQTTAQTEAKTTSATAEPSKSQSTSASKAVTATESALISKSEAKKIALNRANVKEQDISRYEIELDYDDDARAWEYEIGFYVGSVEYDLEISAEDGRIIRYEREEERRSSKAKTTAKTTASSAKADVIGRDQAKKNALERANVHEQDISRYEIELDYDDDARRWEYEISFNVGKVEYDVTIDATSGRVIEFEKDVD